MQIALVFPHQLYKQHAAVQLADEVWLVESPLLFGTDAEYPFSMHAQKLVLHRASMHHWKDQQQLPVRYFEYAQASCEEIAQQAKKVDATRLICCDPVDYLLEKRLKAAAEELQLPIKWLDSPNFICTTEEIEEYFQNRSGSKKYFQTDFYIWQRKRLSILVDDNKKPIGEKWTYDTENRKKFPKDIVVPDDPKQTDNHYVKNAKKYIDEHFSDNFGNHTQFNWPTTHEEAEAVLQTFIQEKLQSFGPYQDAMTHKKDSALFHSRISSSLNIGLLDPQETVSAVLHHYKKQNEKTRKEILASVEGFIRQVIGWREFVRAVYILEGVKQRTSNYFDHENKLTKKWYVGATGLKPVDHVIAKLTNTAYSHHIERLMVVGNSMLLAELHPTEVYRWFMETHIDSYDWVMVPNVYGMSQYADGGLMVSKPYVSGANYISKMSDYPSGDWKSTWTGLYWRFLSVHAEKLKDNPRMGMMYRLLEKMSDAKLDEHIETAAAFLGSD